MKLKNLCTFFVCAVLLSAIACSGADTVDETNDNITTTLKEEVTKAEEQSTTTQQQQTSHVHVYTEKVTKAAACDSEGIKTFNCECGDTYTEAIKATGHSYGEYKYNNDATYTSDGTETKTCSGCGKTETQTAAGTRLSYTYSEMTQTMYAKSDVSVRNLPSADGSEIGSLKGEQKVEVTGCCAETSWYRIVYGEGVGYVSNEWLTENNPHVHSYTSAVTSEATCTKDGVKTFSCGCGDTYTEVIKATGHKYGEYKYNNDATSEKDGTETAVCSTCGVSDTRTAAGTMTEASDAELTRKMYAKRDLKLFDAPSAEGNVVGSLSKGQEVTVTLSETGLVSTNYKMNLYMIGEISVRVSWYCIAYGDGVAYVDTRNLTETMEGKDYDTWYDFWGSNGINSWGFQYVIGDDGYKHFESEYYNSGLMSGEPVCLGDSAVALCTVEGRTVLLSTIRKCEQMAAELNGADVSEVKDDFLGIVGYYNGVPLVAEVFYVP